MAVIAVALGHSGTRMTEKHYAALAPNYVAETIRAHLPDISQITIKSKFSCVAVNQYRPSTMYEPSILLPSPSRT